MKPFTSSCIKFVRVRRSDFYIGIVFFRRLSIGIFLPIVIFALTIITGMPVNTRFITHRSTSFVPVDILRRFYIKKGGHFLLMLYLVQSFRLRNTRPYHPLFSNIGR